MRLGFGNGACSPGCFARHFSFVVSFFLLLCLFACGICRGHFSLYFKNRSYEKVHFWYILILCSVAPAACVSRISRMFVNLADAGPQPMLPGGANKNSAFGACYSLDGFVKPQSN